MKSKAILLSICTSVAILLVACKSYDGKSTSEEAPDVLISSGESEVKSTQTSDISSDTAIAANSSSNLSSYSDDVDNDNPIDSTISKIKKAGFSLDITQYYDFEKAEWKQGAEAELQQMQINSPSEFSRIVSKVYAILDEYEQSVQSR